MKLCIPVGLRLGYIVLDEDPAPLSLPPQFSVHVHSGQTAGWIKTSLGTEDEVGLGPGHIVLDGDPTPLPKNGGRAPPIFGLSDLE